MKTYLIISKDKETKAEKVSQLKNRLKIQTWNLHLFKADPSIGIDKVRRIKELVNLKPYSPGNGLIVLDDFHYATIEAQNALLKLLEEPPENIYFVVTSKSSDKILPTIVSRCQILKIGKKSASTSFFEKEEKIFWKILKASLGERIAISETIGKSKEEVLHFLERILISLQKYFNQPFSNSKLTLPQIAETIKKVEMAKTYVERNINYKATLDILFLGFPHITS